VSLRERLSDPRIVVAVGAHDGLTATLAERAGFEAVYAGGYAVAAHNHGLPDIGLVGLGEVAASLVRMTAVTTVPVVVDADTGYGSEPGVRRSVIELERAGAAAIQIEDQVFPKRCGHFEGKQLIAVDEMVLKLKAALTARQDPDFVLIARTDARAVEGIDAAIARARCYAEAGADVCFVEAPTSVEELRRIPREVPRPMLANMLTGGVTPILSVDELGALGFKIAVCPIESLLVTGLAVQKLIEQLKTRGRVDLATAEMMTFSQVKEVLGLDDILGLRERLQKG
jgi:2,3-dimethylmalate lyase